MKISILSVTGHSFLAIYTWYRLTTIYWCWGSALSIGQFGLIHLPFFSIGLDILGVIEVPHVSRHASHLSAVLHLYTSEFIDI